MTDAGFFRGTSADQDNRFANKQKKLLKELNFSPILNTKLITSKIDIDSLRPWIDSKIKEILEKDDELLSDSIFEHLAEKEPDGKNILVLITGFVDDSKASKFMEELWTKLIDMQENGNGVAQQAANDSGQASRATDNHTAAQSESKNNIDKLNERGNKNNSKDEITSLPSSENPKRNTEPDSSRSSHTVTPPSRSVSKSPGGNHKLDERSRGRPRKRLQDDNSRDGSNPPAPVADGATRRSKSPSNSRSASGEPRRKKSAEPGEKSKSSSRSKSRHSGSRSRSKSYSRSKSGSTSRSRSRSSGHRARSPYSGIRGRRSRSRSRERGFRPKSRSPRARRGFSGRAPFRGSFGYQDRRRGGPIVPPFRRRTSPWGRRRFSPRSPIRRRRSPSFSPRRRSPSPYNRRQSRSRSPLGHMMGRDMHSPPHRPPGGHLDMMRGRHIPHHELHRPLAPMARSPIRRVMDYRGYGDGHLPPRHSPGQMPMSKLPDMPPPHGLAMSLPGPSGAYSPPSSSKKKHKKDKKHHRKHKKSKKHRDSDSSPDRKRKKHKKHKKTKKHK